jgi:hypothetical protein
MSCTPWWKEVASSQQKCCLDEGVPLANKEAQDLPDEVAVVLAEAGIGDVHEDAATPSNVNEKGTPVVTTDVITYSGSINSSGYEAVCDALKRRTSDRALLVLATPGGDPHAGFRIARALQHCYGGFDALVPRYCKSAGTLVLLGAKRLFLGDMSELGPLDIQIKKGDEIIGRNSGLDILQAVNYLQVQAMAAFRSYLLELTRDGLSTRVASDIASKLTTGLFEPVTGQIDPMRLAEMQRATEIAFEYGSRLAEKSGNLRGDGVKRLVTSYPSHGFVIDRKEARSIFTSVERPEGLLLGLCEALHAGMKKSTNAQVAEVNMFTVPMTMEVKDANAPNQPRGEDGAHGGNEPVGDVRPHGTETGHPSIGQSKGRARTGNRGPKRGA